jgi:hypothetical protein
LNQLARSEEIQQRGKEIAVRPLLYALTEDDDIEFVARVIRDRSEVRMVAVEMADLLTPDWLAPHEREVLDSSARQCAAVDRLLADLVREQPVPQDYAKEYKGRYFEPPHRAGYYSRELRPQFVGLFEKHKIRGPLLNDRWFPWLSGAPSAGNSTTDQRSVETLDQPPLEFGPGDGAGRGVQLLPGWA